MRIQYVKQYILASSDQKSIRDKLYAGLINFAEPENMKSINTLLNNYVITDKQMNGILLALDVIKINIHKRINSTKEALGDLELPEHAGGFSLVLRPKEFMQVIFDGFDLHLQRVEELRNVLLIETRDDEDEEYVTKSGTFVLDFERL